MGVLIGATVVWIIVVVEDVESLLDDAGLEVLDTSDAEEVVDDTDVVGEDVHDTTISDFFGLSVLVLGDAADPYEA